MMTEEIAPDRKIKKAIIKLQTIHPFFAHLSMSMKVLPMPRNSPYKTAGVDAEGNLYYHDGFINKMSTNMTIGVVCHETLHVALNHIGRTGTRHRMISNIAQDMVVNMICAKNQLEIPQGPEYVNVDVRRDTASINLKQLGESFITIDNVSEKSWERIYNELISNMKDPEKFKQRIDGIGAFGMDFHDHESFNKLSDVQKSEVFEKMRQALSDAYAYSKQQGKGAAGIERYIDGILNPKVPWQGILAKFLKRHSDPNDYSYRRPHRHSFSLEIYLPFLEKESIEGDVVVDISGSVNKDGYKSFISELFSMMRSFKNIKLHVTFYDDGWNPKNRILLSKNNEHKLKYERPIGGGGTDMEAALDKIRDERRKTDIVIVLTDGYTDCERNQARYPFDVLWVISEDGLEMKDAIKHFRYGTIAKM
jgi:predicted metal-dependent peptidase